MIKQSLVTIPIDQIVLSGDLIIPDGAKGTVIFAHGSGSSRFSPRNQYVASVLQHNNLATLLVDLLTVEEDEIDRTTRHLRFDIELLADRLAEIGNWIVRYGGTSSQKIGYFGASTGAAAALIAAARQSDLVAAVVSRGGRPDLAMRELSNVTVPTLLIVGARDTEVLTLNQRAIRALAVSSPASKLAVVKGATHLFEETGTLEEVSRLASDWFAQWLKN